MVLCIPQVAAAELRGREAQRKETDAKQEKAPSREDFLNDMKDMKAFFGKDADDASRPPSRNDILKDLKEMKEFFKPDHPPVAPVAPSALAPARSASPDLQMQLLQQQQQFFTMMQQQMMS